MTNISGIVAENKERILQRESTTVSYTADGRRELTFSWTVSLSVDIEVQYRPLNGGLISGNRNEENGSGRGVSGDVRGEWKPLLEDYDTAKWTRDGRRSVIRSIIGVTNIDEIALGNSSTDASLSDSQLISEESRRTSFNRYAEIGDIPKKTVFQDFRFQDVNEIYEIGLFDVQDRLLWRGTFDEPIPANGSEMRILLTIQAEGSGRGSTIVSKQAENSVVESTLTGERYYSEIAFGEGGGPEPPDYDLESEVFRQIAFADRSGSTMELYTDLRGSDPGDSFDLSELGFYNRRDRLLFGATFDPFGYDEDTTARVIINFRVR